MNKLKSKTIVDEKFLQVNRQYRTYDSILVF